MRSSDDPLVHDIALRVCAIYNSGFEGRKCSIEEPQVMRTPAGNVYLHSEGEELYKYYVDMVRITLDALENKYNS
jgi:hypothetical protein